MAPLNDKKIYIYFLRNKIHNHQLEISQYFSAVNYLSNTVRIMWYTYTNPEILSHRWYLFTDLFTRMSELNRFYAPCKWTMQLLFQNGLGRI